ncbi:hypothetical protein F5887DRAFT_1162694 [Amanita rubescens]|nr:hypothetical protein F5887DRAFT_1162694 [Amanita rubescens]
MHHTTTNVINGMPTRHKDYYFEDIIFLVEDQLFKVPRHLFLQESEIFRDILSCPVPKGARPDGLSDDQPLQLQGIAAKDFVLLLQCMYPILHFTQNPQFPAFEKMEEWTAVLDLASRFEMTNIKQIATDNLISIMASKPALQAHMGRKHHVKEWVISGLNKLIQRAEPLNKEEAELIGTEDALKVMALRETCVYDPYNCRWTRRERGQAPLDFSQAIRRGFSP